MIYSGPPPVGTVVPDVVRELAAGDPVHPVWLNQEGGVTFRLGDGAGRRFLKWAPPGKDAGLAAEAARLRWASPYVTVPPVLAEGADATGSWLVTQGIPGEFAVADRWKRDPASTVAEI